MNATGPITALSLGGPVIGISAEETAAVEKVPGDILRGWELWKRKAMRQPATGFAWAVFGQPFGESAMTIMPTCGYYRNASPA